MGQIRFAGALAPQNSDFSGCVEIFPSERNGFRRKLNTQ
jgi:hypothetical protein